MMAGLARARAFILEQPTFRTTLILSIVLIGLGRFGSQTPPLLHAVLLATCALMIFVRGVRESLLAWSLLTIFLGGLVSLQWELIDNHKWLLLWWSLACAVALTRPDPSAVLARSARLFIGLAFGFATVWKLLADEYLDGSFFYFTFLTRKIFVPFITAVTDMDPALLAENARLLTDLHLLPAVGGAVTLHGHPTVRVLALISSYWTILIEGSIALAFLAPRTWRIARIREALLLIFIGTPYLLTPVERFALALTMLGFTQTAPDRPRLRLLWLGLFIGLQFINFIPGLWWGVVRTIASTI